MFSAHPVWAAEKSSTCYGTSAKGSLENGVALPEKGKNFDPFASLAVMLGRTYVHNTVKAIVVESYQKLNGKLKLNSKQAWVRHDEHIHVDFGIPCKKVR